MAETQTLSPEQQAQMNKLREIAAKAGMDPNNDDHLGFAHNVVNAVLEQTKTPEELLAVAKDLNIDATPYVQDRPAGLKESLDILNKLPAAEPKLKELSSILEEGEKINKASGFAAFLNLALSIAGAVGGLLLTNNMLVKKNKKDLPKTDNARYKIESKLGRRATRFGTTLAGGGIVAFISNKLLLAPKQKKLDALAEKSDTINAELSQILMLALQEEVAIRAVAVTYQEQLRAQQEQEQQQQKQQHHQKQQDHEKPKADHHKGNKAPVDDIPNPQHAADIAKEHQEVDADPDALKLNNVVKKPDEPGYTGKITPSSGSYAEDRAAELAGSGERLVG